MQHANDIFCLNCCRADAQCKQFDLTKHSFHDYYIEHQITCDQCKFPFYTYGEAALAELNGEQAFKDELRFNLIRIVKPRDPEAFCIKCSAAHNAEYRLLANYCINTSEFYTTKGSDMCMTCWRLMHKYTPAGHVTLHMLLNNIAYYIPCMFCIRCNNVNDYKILINQLSPMNFYVPEQHTQICSTCHEPSFHRYTTVAQNILVEHYRNEHTAQSAPSVSPSVTTVANTIVLNTIAEAAISIDTPTPTPSDIQASPVPTMTNNISASITENKPAPVELTTQLISEIYEASSVLSSWDDLADDQKTDLINYAKYVRANRERLLSNPDPNTFTMGYNWKMTRQVITQFILMIATM